MKRKQRSLLLTSNFLHIFGLSMLATVYALYSLKLGATAWQIGIALGIYDIVAGIGNIVVGRLIDGAKRDRAFVVIGYTITIVAIILFSFAHNASQLYLIQIINGIGLALYMPAWKALYTKAESRGHLASQWGLFDGGNMIAMAGAAVSAGYLANANRYPLMFTVIIVLYGLSTIMSLRLDS